jgi:two-component system LytT family response regulator
MKIRALLVDDEKPARARLKRMLEVFPEIEVVGEASDGLDALEQISTLTPEVVFLDIEMPELDGLGVARSLGLNGPSIVFVTAFDEHALKAFESNALDYLVKPVADVRLKTTVQKLLKRHSTAIHPETVAKLSQQMGNEQEQKFAVKVGSKFVVCDPKKISAIIARDHYAAILTEGRELLSDDSLDHFESRLNDGVFMRVHRSAIVNLSFVQELEREGDRKYVAILSEPKKMRVPISREKIDDIKDRLRSI